MINKTNPVILYLSDIIVVVSQLFVNVVQIRRIKIVVIMKIILYFLSGN